jgi:hypothetical protein
MGSIRRSSGERGVVFWRLIQSSRGARQSSPVSFGVGSCFENWKLDPP